MKDIKTLYFEDVECFVSYVMCKLDELDLINYEDISIIASASEVADLVAEFIRYGMDIGEINVSSPDYDLYDGEYVITLSNLGIWCEKYKRDGEYSNVDGTIIYISNNANSKCLSYVKSDKIYCFEIVDDSLEDDLEIGTPDDECNCCVCCGSNDNEADGTHSITIRTNIGVDELEEIIDRVRESFLEEMDAFSIFRHRRL